MKQITLYCILLLSIASCKRALPINGQTSTINMSNSWWVTLKHGDTTLGPVIFLSTYNTSANDGDSLWIDEFNYLDNDFIAGDSVLYRTYGIGLASFKATVAIQYSAETFGVTNADNAYWTGDTTSSASVTITNGKILPKAGYNPSGVNSDSIYFQIVFSKNPALTFTVSGLARTGFDVDER
jgi:hypothetical protein